MNTKVRRAILGVAAAAGLIAATAAPAAAGLALGNHCRPAHA